MKNGTPRITNHRTTCSHESKVGSKRISRTNRGSSTAKKVVDECDRRNHVRRCGDGLTVQNLVRRAKHAPCDRPCNNHISAGGNVGEPKGCLVDIDSTIARTKPRT